MMKDQKSCIFRLKNEMQIQTCFFVSLSDSQSTTIRSEKQLADLPKFSRAFLQKEAATFKYSSI